MAKVIQGELSKEMFQRLAAALDRVTVEDLGLPIASEIAVVYLAALHKISDTAKIPVRYEQLMKSISQDRQDAQAKLLRRVFREGINRKNLAAIERLIITKPS